MFFEMDKCFLLPTAMTGIRGIRAFYRQHPQAELLIVGHTDRDGPEQYNLDLSIERADSMRADLKDEVDAWVAWFGMAKAWNKRWGTREVQHMLSATSGDAGTFYKGAVHGAYDAKTREAVKDFQRWSNTNKGTALRVDGVLDKPTQTEIVRAYMGLDGATFSARSLKTHGCGEFHRAVETADGVSKAENRRVEIFFFDDGPATPAPAACKAPKGCAEYKQWEDQICEEIDFTLPPKPFVVRAAWSKPSVIPEGCGAPADAEVEMRIETEGVPDDTAPEIEVLNAVTGASVGKFEGKLFAFAGKVYDHATDRAPVWKFTAAHHRKAAWEPPQSPFYYFRVTFPSLGCVEGGESNRATEPPEPALRLLYAACGIGDFTGDLPAIDGEMAYVAGTIRSDDRFRMPVAETKRPPRNRQDYGERVKSFYVLHSSGHGLAYCRNPAHQRSLPPKPDRGPKEALIGDAEPLDVCPNCGSKDIEVMAVVNWDPALPGEDVLGKGFVHGRGFILVIDPHPHPPAPGPPPAPPPGPRLHSVTRKNVVDREAVAAFPNGPKLVVFLNNCKTGRNDSLARAFFEKGTRYVIGWGYDVADFGAALAAEWFYHKWMRDHRGDPERVRQAFKEVIDAYPYFLQFRPRFYERGRA